MVLPGRIFLKQSGTGIQAFSAILKGIEITGILNGSNLSDSAVWPDMNEAFMLFFARNRVPSDDHYFHFVTPHFEKKLNDKGRVRIDYQSAQPVATTDALENPWLLKALAMGTSLDVEILRKLGALEWPTVDSYWKSQKLYSGVGYILSPNNRDQRDASFIRNLPNFVPSESECFSVDVSSLKKFGYSTAHKPRSRELYASPLLIVPQSPGPSIFTPKSYILREDIAFSQSYYGFSAHNLSDSSAISFLHLITHSELFRYYILLTCSRMGAERRTMTKSDLENFAFPPIHLLPDKQRKMAKKLSHKLEIATSKPWEEINDFIYDLYNIDKYDCLVVKDTLKIAEPYKESRDRANAPTTKAERNIFYDGLHQLISPSFSVTNESVCIDEVQITNPDIHLPWYFFFIYPDSIPTNLKQSKQNRLIYQITKQANKTGCSRVVVHEKEYLLVGIIDQYRYWTLSRARLCALDILRHHLDHFPVRGK